MRLTERDGDDISPARAVSISLANDAIMRSKDKSWVGIIHRIVVNVGSIRKRSGCDAGSGNHNEARPSGGHGDGALADVML